MDNQLGFVEDCGPANWAGPWTLVQAQELFEHLILILRWLYSGQVGQVCGQSSNIPDFVDKCWSGTRLCSGPSLVHCSPPMGDGEIQIVR